MENMTFLPLLNKLKDYLKPIREVLYGMTVHEMDLELKKVVHHRGCPRRCESFY